MSIRKFKFHKSILVCLIGFSIISLMAIQCSTKILNSTYHDLVFKQIIWYLLGFAILITIIKLGNTFFIKNIKILYIFGNILLIGLFFFGKEINHAKCWYVLPGIGNFQPSEFMKIILIIYLSYLSQKFYLLKNKTLKEEIKLFIKVIIVVGIPSIITFLQPDTGAVLMYLVITVSILFISKVRLRWFILLLALAASSVTVITFLYFFHQQTFIDLLGTSFFLRIERLTNWSNGQGFQLVNSLISISNGKMLGSHIPSIYYPEPQTDFIFATISSCFGFIGAILTIIIFIIFDILIINCGIKSQSPINKLIIAGICGVLIYQQIQNIGMTIGILPITGITLPFISYGGSSLFSYMILIGIVMNINNETKHQIN